MRQHPEVELAYVFGSRARGGARPDSDVDVAVLGADVDRLRLAAEIASATGLEADVVDMDLDAMPIPLLEALLRDGVRVQEARRGAEGRWRSHAIAVVETDRPWFARMRDAFLKHIAREGV